MVLEIAVAFVITVTGLALLPRADGTCLLAAGLVLGFGAVMHYAKTGTLSPWVTRGTAAALVIVALCLPSAPAEEAASDVRMISPPATTSAAVLTTRATTTPTTAPTTAPTTTTAVTRAATTTTRATTVTSTVPMTTTAAPVIAWTEPTTETTTVPQDRSAPEETTIKPTEGTKVSLANTSIVIPEARYVLNTSSKIIHNPWCQSVQAISQKNYQETNATIEELEAMGYRKCRMHGDWDD